MTHATYSTRFGRLAQRTAQGSGHPAAFAAAALIIVIWVLTGPLFRFSDTWQLVINTGTTIVTFLMVFLIQNSQNRDSAAIQIKLDELIRAVEGAHNSLLDLETLDAAQLEVVRSSYKKLAEEARRSLSSGQADTSCPAVGASPGVR
jgi:low affinity Fe/Cu permease